MTSAAPKVAFDGTILAAGPITGVGRSFVDALRAYTSVSSADPILLVPQTLDLASVAPTLRGIPVHSIPPGRGVRRWLALRRAVREVNATVLHCPVASVPPPLPADRFRRIATVHDLPWRAAVPLDEPALGWRHRLAARWAASSADAVLVPSEFTRKALIADHPGAAPRIHRIPHGVGVRVRRDRTATISEQTFLVLGDNRPRKNRERLREAWRKAHAADRTLPPLRFLGPPDAYVDEDSKWRALCSACALIHVSLHEGFGLPILEAFAAGTPVVTSNLASMPEVSGDAALLVDPTDPDAIAAALVAIHRNSDIRGRCIERGRARAELFSIDQTAASWMQQHRNLTGSLT